jgi:hypothetical protein
MVWSSPRKATYSYKSLNVTTMQHGFVSSNRAGLDEDDSPLSGESWQGRNYEGQEASPLMPFDTAPARLSDAIQPQGRVGPLASEQELS